MDGQVAAVALAPVAIDFDQPTDVLAHFTAKVSLDRVLLVDEFADADHLLVGQLARFGVGVDPRRREDLVRTREPDPKYVRESDLDALVVRNVDAGNSCHVVLSLPLLVLGVFANHHHAPVPTDNLALVATWLDGCSDFHNSPEIDPWETRIAYRNR